MKHGILGGTFDPIHTGHLILAEEARLFLGLDRVTFVPAGMPWRKAARGVTATRHRLAMTELAIADNPAFAVSDLEARKGKPSYTVETLAQFAGQGDELFFIVGADALVDMCEWVRPEEIVRQAQIVVARRSGHDDEAIQGAAARVRGLPKRLILLPMPVIEISSSDLRKRARKGQQLRYLVSDRVAAYIRQHVLYSSPSSDEALHREQPERAHPVL